jgi:hypothetical protein
MGGGSAKAGDLSCRTPDIDGAPPVAHEDAEHPAR